MDAMLADMSSRLFSEWMAYHQLEPFGDELLDVHLARLASIQVSTAKKQVPLDKMRLWKRVNEKAGSFDPHEFYDSLKKAFQLEKKE